MNKNVFTVKETPLMSNGNSNGNSNNSGSNSKINTNSSPKEPAPTLEHFFLTLEKIVSRQNGQIIKCLELTEQTNKDNANKIASSIDKSLTSILQLNQETILIKQAMATYGEALCQLSETVSNFSKKEPLTKEQLNQAINFLVTKLANNDLTLLRNDFNQIASLISTFVNNQNDSHNSPSVLSSLHNSLQVVINQLTVLQKQQQSQQTQLNKIISHLSDSFNNNNTNSLNNNNNNSLNNNNTNSSNNTNANNINNPFSMLGNKLSSTVKAVTSNKQQQQNQNAVTPEKFYSIPATSYQISAKALKQLAIVLIGIVGFLIFFK